MMSATSSDLVIAAYDRRAVETLVTTLTPRQLLAELSGESFDRGLDEELRAHLDEACQVWVRLALADLPLRDALIVDPMRGGQVWDALCAQHITARCTLHNDEASGSLRAAYAAGVAPRLDELPTTPALADARAAVTRGAALAAWPAATAPRFPPPDQLERLLPPLPSAMAAPQITFEQPEGVRRLVATLLVLAGSALVGGPMLFGSIPSNPAGLPLALLTLGLLIGIRARPIGYVGSVCIWLVANLPGFHHDGLAHVWPFVPLLILGLILLALDPRVRAMWRWIRKGMRF